MTVRLTTCLVLLAGAAQVASCITYDCGTLDLVESGVYRLHDTIYDRLDPQYTDLLGAQLTIDRDTETSTIRYTRDGTTYEVRHSLTKL
ncbi:hypothetical protein [Enhygromyxa salina]|uniref:Lipoprotein n=1 Tax=Enhygromyxa salina TaxID=215803 RepID=A0A2S9YIY5_9BACT|nr:hypothetical protein [Enhygromyxa salina]PRQ05002.1 hypothetical protein ENSA7_49350 [Enhygromyxa salina]